MKIDDKFLVHPELSIRDAMKKLDKSHRKILFLVKGNKLAGVLTDGDIRRWILRGHGLEDHVIKVCNLNPISVSPDYNLKHLKKLMLENRIQAVPVVNSDTKLLKLLFWDQIFDNEYDSGSKDKISMPVVIMAGGAGTRLDPFTRILPKPLIPIDNRTIVEVIIDKFREYSINKFFISVHHKSKLIKAYFDELSPSYEIEFIDEDFPQGTVGALGQLKNKINDSIFLTNCDTIILSNYNEMIKFHDENNYDITLVGSMINQKVPYGICEIMQDGKLVNLIEKPEYSHLVSTGMYVLRNTAVKMIPKDSHFNITDLIDVVRKNKGNVGVFPISEKSWLDTGEWDEYKKTVELLNK